MDRGTTRSPSLSLAAVLCAALLAGCSRGGTPGEELPGGSPDDTVDLADPSGGGDQGGGGSDGAPEPAACAADTDCGGDACVVGRCSRLSDETIATTILRSPNDGLVAGVDRGGPLRIFSEAREAADNRDYVFQAVKDAGLWTGGRYGGPVSNGDGGLRPVRDPAGKIVCGYIAGGMAYVPEGGAADQKNLLRFVSEYSPKGELYFLTIHEENLNPGNKQPVRLWSKRAGTWQSELVFASVPGDTPLALRFRADGTPEVLIQGYKKLSIARKGLDAWAQTELYAPEGTHYGGLRVHNLPDGTSHVFVGTRVFPGDPSRGHLLLDYVKLAADGAVARRERLPVGGQDFSLMGSDTDGRGNAYALVRGQVSADRYPTHLLRVTPTRVYGTVIANFERTIGVRGLTLAVSETGTVHLVVETGYNKPVQVRTLTPR